MKTKKSRKIIFFVFLSIMLLITNGISTALTIKSSKDIENKRSHSIELLNFRFLRHIMEVLN